MLHSLATLVLAGAMALAGPSFVNTDFKDFEGTSYTTGKKTTLGAVIKGKVAVVDFWASWCGPCRNEISTTLIPLHDKYKNDSRVVIVGVDVSDKPEKHDTASKALGIKYPQIIDDAGVTGELYNIEYIPRIIVIDATGKIVADDVRGEAVGEAVKKALK